MLRQTRHSADWDILVKLNDALNDGKLLFRSLIRGVNLERLEELMPCALVVTMVPENQTPDDPVVRVLSPFRGLFNDLLYLFDCLMHFGLLEKRKGPMPIAGGRTFVQGTVKLRLSANIDSLCVKLVKVEQIGQVAVRIGVGGGVQLDAASPVLHSRVVIHDLEVCKA